MNINIEEIIRFARRNHDEEDIELVQKLLDFKAELVAERAFTNNTPEGVAVRLKLTEVLGSETFSILEKEPF